VRNWPRERWGRAPMRSISAVTRSMDAWEAFCCMTMIKAVTPKRDCPAQPDLQPCPSPN